MQFSVTGGMGLLTACLVLLPILGHAVETIELPAQIHNIPQVMERTPLLTSVLEVSKKIVRSGDQVANGAFWAVVFYAPIVLLAAFVYRHFLKEDFPSSAWDLEDAEARKQQKLEHDLAKLEFKRKADAGKWQSGLFDCWKGRKDDIWICCCALQFPFIRWADTVNMANLINFWGALGIILFLYALSAYITGQASGEYGAPASGGVGLLILCICVYFRQRLRKTFQMPTGGETLAYDCLAWILCGPCVIAQEARQVELASEMKWKPHDADVENTEVPTHVARGQLAGRAQAVPVGPVRKQWIRLKIVSAKGLPVGDMFTSDPYCVLEYTAKGKEMEKVYQTHVVQRTLDPVWKDCEYDMEIGEGDLLMFKIYDKNRVMLDTELCGAQLDIIRLVSHFDRELTLQGGPRLRATLRVQYNVIP